MAAKSASNLFLFTNEDGSPMVFVITPGDTKKRLRPIVESGGGLLTSKDTPGAIRLVAPDCKVREQLVCSDFVFDSYKNGKLCNMEDYRLESKPDVASPKSHVTVKSEKALKSGRIKYSPEEDQAILDYIKRFKGHVKLSGNKIWQKMEEKNITCHRWQSMRSRYLSFLRQSTHTSSFRGKIEFVGRMNSSRSQTAENDNTGDNVSPCQITEPNSLGNNGKVNEDGSDKEYAHASLPNMQQTLTSLNHNHDEKVQQTLETKYLRKKQNSQTSNEPESQTIEVEDVCVTSCTTPIVGTSSSASCEKKNLQDGTVSESNIHESPKSCHTGIRKYFKAQTNDITSDKVAEKSGNEHVVPEYNKDNTNDFNHGNKKSADDCVPVLKCNQLFENFQKLQMISSMYPSQAQILHALYVSCGCLKCALYYLHKGLLPNGQEIWKREEDTAISSGDIKAIEQIVGKRGQKAVNNRKQFLSSF